MFRFCKNEMRDNAKGETKRSHKKKQRNNENNSAKECGAKESGTDISETTSRNCYRWRKEMSWATI